MGTDQTKAFKIAMEIGRWILMLIGLWGCVVNGAASLGVEPIASQCPEIPFCILEAPNDR